MQATGRCGVCRGPTRHLYSGRGLPLDADLLAPTNHTPTAFSDLYECRSCGTVSQPVLSGRGALAGYYREMQDDDYLAEERGRRTTARRLLKALSAHVRGPRLLDVGCGHGLLLDEARRLDYQGLGIDPSRTAVAYAREELGLNVQEATLEELPGHRGGFDLIVMSDVIEHLADPMVAIDRCRELLAAGGVLCVVTPDPSSLMRRIAGPRWWGFLPGHIHLLPPAALNQLLSRAGLTVVAHFPLERTFSLRYWLLGLLERLPGGQVLQRGAARLSLERLVSLRLRDEHVTIARQAGPARHETESGTR